MSSTISSQLNGYTILDGTNEYIDIDTLVASVIADTTGGIGFYYTPVTTMPVGTDLIFSLADTSAVGELSIFQTSGGTGELYFILRSGGVQSWYYRTTANPLSAGVKSHISLTQGASGPVMHIDGVVEALTAINTTNVSHWIANSPNIDNGRIGCREFNSAAKSNFAAASIDEIMYTGTSLSTAQWAAVVALGSNSPDYSSVPGIKMHLAMDTLNPQDKIGSNHGTSYNMTTALNIVDESDVIDNQGLIISSQTTGIHTLYDGTNERTDLGNDSSLFRQRNLSTSYSGWVNIDSALDDNYVFVGIAGATSRISLFIFAGKLSYWLRSPTASVQLRVNSTTDLVAGTWHHIAATYDGSSTAAGVLLYVDGVAVGRTEEFDNLTADLDFTGFFGYLSNIHKGKIDKFIMYSDVLTPAEVTTAYNYGRKAGLIGIGNEVSQWEMDTLNPIDVIGVNNGASINQTTEFNIIEESDIIDNQGLIISRQYVSFNVVGSPTFDASISTSSDTATWNFGDGSAEVTNNNPSYAYADTNTYEVSIVMDDLSLIKNLSVTNEGVTGGVDISLLTSSATGKRIELNSNPLLTGVTGFTSNGNYQYIFINDSGLVGTLDISNAVFSGTDIRLYNNPSLTSIINPVTSGTVTYDANNCGLVGELDMSGLTGLNNNCKLSSNTLLTSVLLPASSGAITLTTFGNTTIVNFDMSTLTGLAGQIYGSSTATLQSVTLPATNGVIAIFHCFSCDLGYVDFTVILSTCDDIFIKLQDNSMTVGEVNQIAADLDATAWIDGKLEIQGSNAAPDTGVADTITVVNQGTKTFSIAADRTAHYSAGTSFVISGSTGNDGTYTVVSSSFGADCDIIVEEAIPNATADGTATTPDGTTALDAITGLVFKGWTVTTS